MYYRTRHWTQTWSLFSPIACQAQKNTTTIFLDIFPKVQNYVILWLCVAEASAASVCRYLQRPCMCPYLLLQNIIVIGCPVAHLVEQAPHVQKVEFLDVERAAGVCLTCALSEVTRNLPTWHLPAGLCGGVGVFIWSFAVNYTEKKPVISLIRCFVVAKPTPSLHLLYSSFGRRCSLELGRRGHPSIISYTPSAKLKNKLCIWPVIWIRSKNWMGSL